MKLTTHKPNTALRPLSNKYARSSAKPNIALNNVLVSCWDRLTYTSGRKLLTHFTIYAFVLSYSINAQAQVKIGENPDIIDGNSVLELESTSKALLLPRLTTAQRDAQSGWIEGHMIYNTTERCIQNFNATEWECLNNPYLYRGELGSTSELQAITCATLDDAYMYYVDGTHYVWDADANSGAFQPAPACGAVGWWIASDPSTESTVWANDAGLTTGASSFTQEMFHGEDVVVATGAGNEIIRLSNDNDVGTIADIYFRQAGLITSQGNTIIQSEDADIDFYTTQSGAANSGTTGSLLRGRFNNAGRFLVGTNSDVSLFPTHLASTLNDQPLTKINGPVQALSGYFRDNIFLNPNASTGQETYWSVRANDGSGNWNMYWNSDGYDATNWQRVSGGSAYNWRFSGINTNSTSSNLIMYYAGHNGTQGSAITWTPAWTIARNGMVGIGRGIGSTNPVVPLHVEDVTSTHVRFETGAQANWSLLDIMGGSQNLSYLRMHNEKSDTPDDWWEFRTYGTAYTTGAGTTANRRDFGLLQRRVGQWNWALYINDNNTHVGFNDNNPTYRIELPNTANASGRGRANAWVTYSDGRFKKNRKNITDVLEKVVQLQGVEYDNCYPQFERITTDSVDIIRRIPLTKDNTEREIGFIAQDLKKVFPELVSETQEIFDDGEVLEDYHSVDYNRMTVYLVEAIKEQNELIKALREELDELKRTRH